MPRLECVLLAVCALLLAPATAQVYVTIDWNLPVAVSNTTPTLQVVVNPLIMRGSPIHDSVFKGLAALKAEHVRFVPWFPYPELVVAELDPPAGAVICDTADAGVNISLQCPKGKIVAITFASFGTPQGRCGSFSTGSCSASNQVVQSVISKACVGHPQCLVLNSLNATFHLPDPCPGQYEYLSVQALCSDAPNTTSWDFSLIDPMMEDFLAATEGGDPIINFSTIPQWMWQTDEPVTWVNYTAPTWNYEQGNRQASACVGSVSLIRGRLTCTVRDESRQDVANYYSRLLSWYTKGGFTDEFGRYYKSGHNYTIKHWEILNEVEFEHSMTPEYYTSIYDAMVTAIRGVVPDMKFVGMALAGHREWDWYNYFLNASNHAAGIPIDYISFHQYASAANRTDPDGYAAFFINADAFFEEVTEVRAIRDKLSPHVKIDIDEIGVILPDDNVNDPVPFPNVYWNAAASYYAYIFGNLAAQNIDYLGESQLVGYPTQFPSVSMAALKVNWTTGEMTARYWVLSLLITHFKARPFTIYSTLSSVPTDLYAMGSKDASGVQRVLLANKSNLSGVVQIDDVPAGAVYWTVDSTTDWKTPKSEAWPSSGQLNVLPYGVYIVVYQG